MAGQAAESRNVYLLTFAANYNPDDFTGRTREERIVLLKEIAKQHQQSIAQWLIHAGHEDEFTIINPDSALSTVGIRCTEEIATLLASAPGVTSVTAGDIPIGLTD